MKGIVFTELIEMVETTFGADIMDEVIDECDLESGGAYTTVCTYDHKELIEIVSKLSEKTDIPTKDLIVKYGHYLFFRFHKMMPQFFEEPKTTFDFLESVHGYIHVEVKKLYPDATLPNFKTDRKENTQLIMTYTSRCPFADFAEGLIQGCIEFYKENITFQTEDKNTKEEYSRVFTLTKA